MSTVDPTAAMPPDDAHMPGEARVMAQFLDNWEHLAASLAQDARTVLQPVTTSAAAMRDHLTKRGHIHPVAEHADEQIVAVDGAQVVEQWYAVDMMIAAASTYAGFYNTDTSLPQPSLTWAKLLRHQPENARLVAAVRSGLELTLLVHAPYDLRLVDGTTTTPLVDLARAVGSHSPDVREGVLDFIDEHDLVATVSRFCGPLANQVVALPKSDSTDVFARAYSKDAGVPTLPGGDHLFASAVLQPGEMLHPRPAREASRVTFPTTDGADDRTRRTAEALTHAVAPLVTAAKNDGYHVTYLRPGTPQTVVKLMYAADAGDAVARGAHLAGRILADTDADWAQEPLPQYWVDRSVKAVSRMVRMLQQRMLADMSASEADQWAPWIVRGYRT